jgi:hypothetical protein
MTSIRYGANGEPMPIKEETVTPKKKTKQEPLQEILEVNPNEEVDALSSEWAPEKEEQDEEL